MADNRVTIQQVLAVAQAYFAGKPMPDFGQVQVQPTVEELIAEHSEGMTDRQLAQYWYELDQTIYKLLGTIDYPVYHVNAPQWKQVAQAKYPTLTSIRIPDMTYTTTTLEGIQKVLTRDWTHLVKYQAEIGDCDDFALRLSVRLADYYKINAVFPVWGRTQGGIPHAFNIGVFKQETGDPRDFIARIIEPQSGSLGSNHIPTTVVTKYAEMP